MKSPLSRRWCGRKACATATLPANRSTPHSDTSKRLLSIHFFILLLPQPLTYSSTQPLPECTPSPAFYKPSQSATRPSATQFFIVSQSVVPLLSSTHPCRVSTHHSPCIYNRRPAKSRCIPTLWSAVPQISHQAAALTHPLRA